MDVENENEGEKRDSGAVNKLQKRKWEEKSEGANMSFDLIENDDFSLSNLKKSNILAAVKQENSHQDRDEETETERMALELNAFGKMVKARDATPDDEDDDTPRLGNDIIDV